MPSYIIIPITWAAVALFSVLAMTGVIKQRPYDPAPINMPIGVPAGQYDIVKEQAKTNLLLSQILIELKARNR